MNWITVSGEPLSIESKLDLNLRSWIGKCDHSKDQSTNEKVMNNRLKYTRTWMKHVHLAWKVKLKIKHNNEKELKLGSEELQFQELIIKFVEHFEFWN